ncbi:hypothetical protein [Paraburkholderia antibiotica]|uniref:hypothetical protein n=1 Tax=Paraburkholderia antibiotica TaxID=2728839 RepID=UPI0019803E34|nr:hypothetical protein [Paraburkholderia antibiotica]
MPCTPFKLPDGTRGFICSRGRRGTAPQCRADGCGAESDFQCDYPVGPRKTCDRHLCATHAHEIAPDVHYCPEHFALWQRAGIPVQASLIFDTEDDMRNGPAKTSLSIDRGAGKDS